MISLASAAVSKLAGSGHSAAWFDGTGTAAALMSPIGVSVFASGSRTLVADAGLYTILSVNVSSTWVSTLVGSGNASHADGIGTSANFDNPTSIAVSNDSTFALVVGALLRRTNMPFVNDYLAALCRCR